MKKVAPTKGKTRMKSRTRKTGDHQFLVKLMRPIFQTTVVSVDAQNEQQAIIRALDGASRLRGRDWKGAFDSSKYTYDVQIVLDADDVMARRDPVWEPGTPADRIVADLEKMEEFEYLLLKGDVEAGQGDLVMQPWLDEKSFLMLADLAGDWKVDIEIIEDEGLEGYRGHLRRNAPGIAVEYEGNVIPFRPRGAKKNDEEDAG